MKCENNSLFLFGWWWKIPDLLDIIVDTIRRLAGSLYFHTRGRGDTIPIKMFFNSHKTTEYEKRTCQNLYCTKYLIVDSKDAKLSDL